MSVPLLLVCQICLSTSLKGCFDPCDSALSFYSVPLAHLATSARHNSLNRFFFPGVMIPSLMSIVPGCLTDVG